MNTLNDQVTINPSRTVKLQDGAIRQVLGDRVPVKTPEGDSVEPTLLLHEQEFFEIDLERLSDRQYTRLVAFYSGASELMKAAFNQSAIALLPSDWVRGVA